MNQEKVKAFVDKTIVSLSFNAVDIDFIISRLKANSDKYREILSREDSPKTKKDYLIFYIEHAKDRISDLQRMNKIGRKIGQSKPHQVVKLLQLRDRLNHKPIQRFAKFD